MRKRKHALSILLSLCILCTIAAPATAAAADETLIPDYYRAVIQQFPNSTPHTYAGKTYYTDTKYALYDIDKNGVPELFIQEDSSWYYIYSYDGTNVVNITEDGKDLWHYPDCLYQYDGNGLVVHDGGMGSLRYEYIGLYTLKDYRLTFSHELLGEIAPSNETIDDFLKQYTPLPAFKPIAEVKNSKPVVNSTTPFRDVRQSDWFYDAAQYVSGNGIMGGTGNNTFSPSVLMNHAMAVTVLHRFAGSPNLWSGNYYYDVEYRSYYKNAVDWASGAGIVDNMKDDRDLTAFVPQAIVTREYLASMIYRYAVLYDGMEPVKADVLTQYPDNGQITALSRNAMNWCVAKGIINGKNNGLLDPKGRVSRAEMATMLMRLSRLPKDGGTGYKQTIEKLLATGGINLSHSLYFDIDGDGYEELLLTHEVNTNFSQTVASVYTMKNGTIHALLKEEELFPNAGGPSGDIGVVEKDGHTYVCLRMETGETGGDDVTPIGRNGFYKLFTLTDNKLSLAESLEYECQMLYDIIPNTLKATLTGSENKKLDFNAYQAWINALKWITEVYVVG